MVSVNTSSTGVASAALRMINAQLATTQNRIATGYKVNSAADNASVWATATKIRSDKTASEALKSSISTAKAQADAGSAALDEVSKILTDMKTLTISAVAAGGATAADVNKMTTLVNQAKVIINGASVGGKNVLLDTTNNNVSVNLNVAEGVSTNMTAAITASDVLSASNASFKDVLTSLASGDIVAGLVTKIDTAQTEVGKISATLTGFSAQMDSSLSFIDKLNDIRDTAIGGLVDADLEKESAKLNALQVKQQLAYQALSIGNSAQQNILRLFQ